MRDYLVAGNWKMNGSRDANAALVDGILNGLPRLVSAGDVKLLICPPFPYLEAIGEKVAGTPVGLGAQNVSEHASGAYTGEVSAAMLRDVGCEYAIVGHSERRSLMGESSQVVAAKFEQALAAGLAPVLCVGETLEQRESEQTERVIDEQLEAVLERVGAAALGNAVIAYEPVWAIGTGRTATPQQAGDVHRYIRTRLAGQDRGIAEGIQILYGGSMKADNAAGLLSMPDIDGGLIGGASLKAEEFLAIAAAVPAS